MSDFGTMKTRVASEILRSSWADTFVSNAILDAISDYDHTRFTFNQARFKLTTVADQEFYSVPSALRDDAGNALATGETLLEIDTFNVRWNNAAWCVQPVTPGWVESYTTTNTRGQPMYYSFSGDRIRLTPIPDLAYDCFIDGMKKLRSLSSGTDTNAWMTTGARLIRAAAKVRLYRDILRDTAMVQNAQSEEATALAALLRAREAQGSQRLQAWGY